MNQPCERAEYGLRFNERWVYHRPRHDPAGAAERIIYWHRYDYVGSMIRKSKDGEWQPDDRLPAMLEHPPATQPGAA